MPKLIRPSTPLEVDLRVLLRQLGTMFSDDLIEIAKERRSLGTIVKAKKLELAELLGCDVNDLRRDHNPALGAREKVFDRDGNHVEYKPKANDPEFLQFIPHGPQFENSHLTKTNVRGPHGQHPDRVLIKRQRRIERQAKERAGLIKPRQKQKIRSASRWPAKGTQKIRSSPLTLKVSVFLELVLVVILVNILN